MILSNSDSGKSLISILIFLFVFYLLNLPSINEISKNCKTFTIGKGFGSQTGMSVAVEMNKVDFRKVSATVNSVFRSTTEIITPVKMKLSKFIFRSEVSTRETKTSNIGHARFVRYLRNIVGVWGHFDSAFKSNIPSV